MDTTTEPASFYEAIGGEETWPTGDVFYQGVVADPEPGRCT